MQVTLYARLEGLQDRDSKFCHAGVEWIGESRRGRVMRSTEDARCIHPPEETRIEHSYTKLLELHEPGVFRYQVILHLKDGTVIRSNRMDVRVLSNN